MDEMEDKLNAILGNPQMMQQIMSMANAMGSNGSSGEDAPAAPADQPALSMEMPDGAMLQKIAGLAQSAAVDRNQQALLHALRPYLTSERIGKLEKAMRASKIAGLATTALGGSFPFLSGR